MSYSIVAGDIYEWAQSYTGSRFHACLCDPPYHLTSIVKRFGKPNSAPAKYGTDGAFARHSGGFMGQQWDGGDVAFRPETWAAIGDCLLPGAYLLAFGGTRTWHRLAVAIEDAGFEIRDTVMWVYGSGFPKSHDVSKAIDKEAGAKREILGKYDRRSIYDGCERISPSDSDGIVGRDFGTNGKHLIPLCSPATDLAKTWNGYGSALKPAWEPVIVARKPLEGTIAQNCVEYGSGGLNIDGCTVKGEPVPINKLEKWSGFGELKQPGYIQEINNKGRWPANLVHDGSDEVLAGFPNSEVSGSAKNGRPATRGGYSKPDHLFGKVGDIQGRLHNDSGSAARFFYAAKASKAERDAGCASMEIDRKFLATMNDGIGAREHNPEKGGWVRNNHPTVKPIALTEYLARLILPPAEYAPRRLLVPFAGSGSEMIGAHKAGWDEITGIELTPEYVEIAEARLKHWVSIPQQLEMV